MPNASIRSKLPALRFLCLRPVGRRRHYVFGLSVRPSGRPSVRPSVRTRISLTRNLKNPLVDFHHTWPRGAPWRVDELIRFWARSAQGQRSKVNELGLRTKVKTAHPFCTHSAPILHCYIVGLAMRTVVEPITARTKGALSTQQRLNNPFWMHQAHFKCILNEKLITTCWNCSSIQRQSLLRGEWCENFLLLEISTPKVQANGQEWMW